MKSVSGKEFAKILEQNGWQLLRINGSHHIYGKPNNPARISVPIHGNQSLKPGLLRHFLKIANLTDLPFAHAIPSVAIHINAQPVEHI